MAAENRAVVIGSGFGGAVAACRLAQAGLDVTVLERGRDYRQDRLRAGAPGAFDFPRMDSGPDAWSWCPEKNTFGLYDVRAVSEMEHLQSAGLGGGSLIYANVHLRVPPDGFARGWPEGYSRETLDPCYDLVAHMLDVQPIPEDRRPPKARALADAAKKLGRSAYFLYPQLAVNFGTPEQETTNRFGQVQEGCRSCGECIVGCRYRAKNTLDLNYLAEAERQGARLHTLCDVRRIDPLSGGGYRVRFLDRTRREEQTLDAAYVFVCAGAVNSTELLLRCRDEFRSLPALGRGLGTRYSGNGDALYFGFNTRVRIEPWTGPTITTALLYDGTQNGVRSWFLLEEGGYPSFFSPYARALRPLDGILRPGSPQASDLRDWLASLGQAAEDRDAHVAVYLCMGRDQARGRLRLLPGSFKLALEWDLSPNVALYNVQERLADDLTRELGGALVVNPAYRLLRLPGTVHSLGGCPMGAAPDNSVTDAWGEVHGYPGLFVLDGGILPEATGTNPTATIAAVAERNVEGFIRRLRNEPAWKCPDAEAAAARPRHDPLVEPARLALAGMPPPVSPAVGLTFTASWAGTLGPTPATAARATPAGFTVAVSLADLDAFLNNPEHPAAAAGTVVVPPLTGGRGVAVTRGLFNLFQAGESGTRRTVYQLAFPGADGQEYVLEGQQTFGSGSPLSLLPRATALSCVVRRAGAETAEPLATGVLRLSWNAFFEQLGSIKVTGTDDPVRQLQARERFGKFVAGNLWEVAAATGPLAALRRLLLRARLWLRDTFGIRDRD